MPEKYSGRKRRYEQSGKRPGKAVLLRLTDEQHSKAQGQRRKTESLAGCIKRLAGLAD